VDRTLAMKMASWCPNSNARTGTKGFSRKSTYFCVPHPRAVTILIPTHKPLLGNPTGGPEFTKPNLCNPSLHFVQVRAPTTPQAAMGMSSPLTVLDQLANMVQVVCTRPERAFRPRPCPIPAALPPGSRPPPPKSLNKSTNSPVEA
jgi:hypothetical protein